MLKTGINFCLMVSEEMPLDPNRRVLVIQNDGSIIMWRYPLFAALGKYMYFNARLHLFPNASETYIHNHGGTCSMISYMCLALSDRTRVLQPHNLESC